ncbi:putative metallo-peptidase, clan MH, family M18 [Trypanosoma cruzi]|nr:putative metallo-peptidase, clan MH, family M18 [Trypanosoma cruzi]
MTSRCRSQRCRRTSSVAATPRTPCPAECEFLFEFRALPNETVSKMMQQCGRTGDAASPGHEAEFEDAEIVITPRDETPSFEGSEEAPITKLACAINNDYKVWKIGWLHGGGSLQWIAGAPTVICGPHGGAIHCANEYVTPRSSTSAVSLF